MFDSLICRHIGFSWDPVFRRVSLARELPQHSSRVSRVLVKRGQGCQANKQESPNSLFFPGVQIVERRRQIHEEKNEGRQLNSLSTDRHALLSERLDGTGYEVSHNRGGRPYVN